ncbi:MAG: DUF2202 domain-containing protein [Spirochaetales bacterium]|jgi:hypothetical protein|nr:DUF2202 domain-containing protein [Spirochaetales bacterium]
MKRKVLVLMVLVTFAAGSVLFAQGYRNRGANGAQEQDGALGQDLSTVLADIPLETLDDREINGLLLMREEEKLARDVYLTLAEEWGIRSFSNIARAEETHMDAVAMILDRYDIEDPVASDTVGEFDSDALADLFDELVAAGKKSYDDALMVGAKVEELDIADLLNLLEITDNDDIRIVYQNLLKGSRNHLRSFDMQISRRNETYTPEFLSSDEYERIASSPRETGSVVTDPDMLF